MRGSRAIQADIHTKGIPDCPGIIHSQVKKAMSTNIQSERGRERREIKETDREQY